MPPRPRLTLPECMPATHTVVVVGLNLKAVSDLFFRINYYLLVILSFDTGITTG
jgi:hypothetical protein